MLSVGIVGLGARGRTLVESAHAEGRWVRFTAACTPHPEGSRSFCSQHGMRLVSSFLRLLEEESLQAVVIATPNSLHAEQVRLAAQAGKHVFVEKPFALTVADARAAVEVARAAGICLAVGFNRRFHPLMRELRERARSGALGTLVSIVADLTATAALYRAAGSWRTNPEQVPAGALAGIGVHLIDAMVDVAGPVREIYCVAAQRAGPHGEDTTHLLLQFESGLTGIAACSLAAARNARFAVYGSHGCAELLGPGMEILKVTAAVHARTGYLASMPEPEVQQVSRFNTLAAELDAFAEVIELGKPHPVPLDQVLHGIAVFEAAVKSARCGAPVALAAHPL